MKFYRLNQQIKPGQLRVIDENGKQIGVLDREEALLKAREAGVDLVEIGPTANPPVCKLIDYKKFRYLEEKRNKESKKKAKAGAMKELWLGPFMSENDLHTRLERAREFLREGHKLRLAVKFAGRQITHPEFGWKVLNRFISELANLSKVEREARFEGKILAVTLIPGKKEHEKTEDTQSSEQTI